MVWIGLVDPEEWMHSSYRTSSKHFTLLYRNYIEQKQNISIVCSFQINIMFVSNRKYLPDNIYFTYMHKQHTAYTHLSPFRPWHVDTSLTSPSCFSHDLSLPPPCRSCHRIEQWLGRRSIRNILASRTFSTTALEAFFRFGSVSPGCQRADVFCWNPRKHPWKEKKIVSLLASKDASQEVVGAQNTKQQFLQKKYDGLNWLPSFYVIAEV